MNMFVTKIQIAVAELNIYLCFNLPTKWQTLLRMKYVLCSVRKGNTNNMMEKKWQCEILHIAGLLNSENPIQIQLKHSWNMYCRRRWGQLTAWKIQTIEQGRGRNGEEEGWWKNVCVSTRWRTRHPLYDDQWIVHHLKTPSWIQNSNQYPRFHVPSLFPHYCIHKLCKAKLSHKILFEDK